MSARDEVDSYIDDSADEELELPDDAPDELQHVETETKRLNETNHRFAFTSKRWWGLLSGFWAMFWFVAGIYMFVMFGADFVALGVGFLVLFGLGFSVASTVNYIRG